MGYYLVQAVMLEPPQGITHRDMLVLVYMAVSARDYTRHMRGYDVPASIYTGGWEWLALVPLRRDKFDDAAKRAVARTIHQLRRLGAIEPMTNPLPASKQRAYLLNYSAPPKEKP